MHLNVPKDFTLNQLRQFKFGNIEAEADQDDLLEEVFCQPTWVTTFMQGNKTILKGHRGTGKTALFESLKRGVLKYNNGGAPTMVVPIDQVLDHQQIRSDIIPKIQSRGRSASLKYRVVWEVFLLYQIGLALKKFDDLPEVVSEAIGKLINEFNPSGEPQTMAKILLSSNRKIGIKLAATDAGFPSADFYFDFSPKHEQANPIMSPESADNRLINLHEVKTVVEEYLAVAKRSLLVVVDKLDDFVSGENLATQRALLQGLLQCDRDYRAFKTINFVLLYRTDLFEQLSLDSVGADKVHARCLDIHWEAADLRAVIGRRIVYCLEKAFPAKDVFDHIDPHSLYGTDVKPSRLKKCIRKLALLWARFTKKQTFDHGRVRIRNLSEAALDKVIHAFFGSEVEHIDKSGSKVTIPIEKYLDTHFRFANGEGTPRVMLMYCQLALETAIDYYTKNPDLAHSIKFPIVPSRSACIAFTMLRRKLWKIHADFDKKWKRPIQALERQCDQAEFTYGQIAALIPGGGDSAIEEFLDHLVRHGVLASDNDILPIFERIYRLPLLFRILPVSQ